jgi:hypothetical protein
MIVVTSVYVRMIIVTLVDVKMLVLRERMSG